MQSLWALLVLVVFLQFTPTVQNTNMCHAMNLWPVWGGFLPYLPKSAGVDPDAPWPWLGLSSIKDSRCQINGIDSTLSIMDQLQKGPLASWITLGLIFFQHNIPFWGTGNSYLPISVFIVWWIGFALHQRYDSMTILSHPITDCLKRQLWCHVNITLASQGSQLIFTPSPQK